MRLRIERHRARSFWFPALHEVQLLRRFLSDCRHTFTAGGEGQLVESSKALHPRPCQSVAVPTTLPDCVSSIVILLLWQVRRGDDARLERDPALVSSRARAANAPPLRVWRWSIAAIHLVFDVDVNADRRGIDRAELRAPSRGSC